MRRITLVLLPAALLAFLATGCYTKLYRPGMEQMGQDQTLYERYDSTAIDTTLIAEELERDTYTPYNDDWSYWGQRRPTRWGFDFYNWTPGYYYGYYGYNDYYGSPWWYNYWDPWYGPGGQPGVPGEPPSKREGGRRQRNSGGSGGSGAVAAPAAPPASTPTYGNPSPPPPASPPKETSKNPPSKPADDGKRGGKRGR